MEDNLISLRVQELEMREFRGFEYGKINFDEKYQTSVFVGVNGSGKSTILDCIAILISWFKARLSRSLFNWSHKDGLFPTSDDVRIGSEGGEIGLRAEFKGKEYPQYKLSCFSGGGGSLKNWPESLDQDLMVIKNKVIHGEKFNLPIIVYYRTNRFVLDIPLESQPNRSYNQLDAYEAAFDASINFHSFFKWYRDKEDFENQEYKKDSSYVDPQLEGIREALTHFSSLEEYTNLAVDRSSKPESMVVSKKTNEVTQEFKFNQLSDGEKCTIAMVADIARRLAIASPGLDNPLEGPGVVLIDEIELHLHPKWQRTVIPDLEKTFPNIQFIVTTHSPQVLSQVKQESIYILKQTTEGIIAERPTDGVYGRDSNHILEAILGDTERPQEQDEKIDELFRLIEEGQLEEAKKLKKTLENMTDDDPVLYKADLLIKRREQLGK